MPVQQMDETHFMLKAIMEAIQVQDAKIESIKATMATKEELAALAAKVDVIEQTMATKDQLEALTTRVESLESNVTILQRDMATVKRDMATVQRDMVTKKEFHKLNSAIRFFRIKLSEHDQAIDELRIRPRRFRRLRKPA